MSLLFSLIIPFYNVEKYISECLASVYEQDIPECEYEVICVDDCSPDGSMAIVEEFRKEHDNLRVICHKENKKLGAARNTGLLNACGEYVWFVDSDDKIYSNCLGRLKERCLENNPDMLHFRYSTKNSIHPFARESRPHPGRDEFFKPYFDASFVWNKVYKRSFLLDNNLTFSDVPGGDILHTIAAFDRSERYMQTQDLCYDYRLDNTSSAVHSKVTGVRLFMYTLNIGHELLKLSASLSEDVRPVVESGGVVKINSFHRTLFLLDWKEQFYFYKTALSNRDVIMFNWAKMNLQSKILINLPPIVFVGHPAIILAKRMLRNR